MRQMEKLFELFNQKEYSSLLKRKLDYVSSLYEDCRNSNEYSIVREIVENFSEIILILEKNEKTNDIIKSEHKANDDYPNFLSTVYWNPAVEVKAGGEFGFDCFMPAYKGKFRVVVEGLSGKGKEIYAVEEFENL
jgi:hypothetical protein